MDNKIKIYDAHVHLFQKNIIEKDIGELAVSLINLIRVTDNDEGKIRATLQNITQFLDAIGKDKTSDVYKTFHENNLEHFSEDQFQWTYTPLSFDLTYADDNDYDLTTNDQELLEKRRLKSLKSLNRILSIIKTIAFNTHKAEYKKIALRAKKLIKVLKEKSDLIDNQNFDIKQVPEMEQLVDEYGTDHIKPFYSVDPRKARKAGVDYIQVLTDKILNGKWHGVKIYSTVGFSPTDPILFDKDGIYEFCEKNAIPITVHNSNGGFASFANKVKIYGDIYDEKTGSLKDFRNNGEGKYLTFEYDFLSKDAGNALHERVTYLNHPVLWEKVLDKFPKLRLNLAHFGGSGQLIELVNHAIDSNLHKISKQSLSLMLSKINDGEDRNFVESLYTKVILSNFYQLKNIYPLQKDSKSEQEKSNLNRKKFWEILFNNHIIDNWSKRHYDLLCSKKYANLYVDLSAFSEGKIPSFHLPHDYQHMSTAGLNNLKAELVLYNKSGLVDSLYSKSNTPHKGDNKVWDFNNSDSENSNVVDLLFFLKKKGKLEVEVIGELEEYKRILKFDTDTELANYFKQNKGFSLLLELNQFKEKLFDVMDKEVKEHILYGSDYYFTQLFGPEHEQYVQDFKIVFGTEMIDIAQKNTEKFLNL